MPTIEMHGSATSGTTAPDQQGCPNGENSVNMQDLQSLLMHQEAVRMVRADASLEARALEILERWDTVASIRSKPLRDEWKRIIPSAIGSWP